MAKNLAISNIQVNNQSVSATPFSILAGDPFDVVWIVDNLGDELIAGGTAGFHIDSVYLSDDNVLDVIDVVLGNDSSTIDLTAYAGSYSSKQRISVLAGGSVTQFPQNKYLIFRTNSSEAVLESDVTDNMLIVPILLGIADSSITSSTSTASLINEDSVDQVSLQVPPSRLIGSIPAPDLEITATAPTIAAVGEKILVNWTVQNTGDLNALKGSSFGWYDTVYLSSDNILDSKDNQIGGVYFTQDLPPNGSYQVNNSPIYIPNGLPSSASNPVNIIGNQYLIFKTNDQIRQEVGYTPPVPLGEINLSNNTFAVPITITAPDLTITKVSTPSSVPYGATVPVTWTVKNDSTLTASGYWSDYIYLSTDQTLDASDSLLYVYSAYSFSSGSVSPLAGGKEYSVTKNITIRSTDGPQYLIFATDATNVNYSNGAQFETNENNNLFIAPINVIAPPDLTIAGSIGTPNISTGGTLPLSWTVSNISPSFAARSPWVDGVYLSNDDKLSSSITYASNGNQPFNFSNDQLNNSDLFLTSQDFAQGDLAAGTSYTINNQNIVLPTGVFGKKYILFLTDINKSRVETNENNNISAVPIQINISDLTVALTSFVPATAILGDKITLTGRVTNSGLGDTTTNWSDNIYISADAILDSGDLRLASLTSTGRTPLVAGNSYDFSQQISIDDDTRLNSQQYLIVKTDAADTQVESDNNNNTVVAPIILNAPDLIVSSITATTAQAEVTSGQPVELSWIVKNQGVVDANGSWTDNIYLSDDANIGNDRFIGSFDFTGNVASGQSIERRQTITLPIDINSSSYRFVVFTDARSRIAEGSTKEINNTTIDDLPIQISRLDAYPNLTVTSITPPTTVSSGQNTVISWQVTNSGNAATSSTFWYDRVWLSQDDTIDTNGADYLLATVINPAYLTPGSSYVNSATVQIPQGLENTVNQGWRILVNTDSGTFRIPVRPHPPLSDYPTVDENDKENDNVTASTPFSITPTPPPDLQVASVIVAPSSPFSGQKVNVTWTVANRGAGRTAPAETQWLDEVLLAKNPDSSGEAYSLGRFTHNGGLTAADLTSGTDRYTNTQQVDLPIGKWNEYFFVVKTDVENKVYEKAFKDNNSGFLDANTQDSINTPSVIQLTPPPDLTILSTTSSVNTVAAGKTIDLTYKVTNYGVTEVPKLTVKWKDKFFISPTASFNAGTARLVGELEHDNNGQSFAVGDSYSNTVILTVPPELVAGNYYLIAYSDYDNSVFEQDDVDAALGGNAIALSNFKATVQPITVVSTPADFVVANVSEIGTLNAGKTGRFTWTVLNQGTGDSNATSWNDQLILSKNDVLGDSDDIAIASFQNYRAALPSGGNYTRTEDVILPFKLNGSYNLFAVTDQVVDDQNKVVATLSNKIFEASNEGNNASIARPIIINRLTPDLVPQSVTANIANSVAGSDVTFSWTVKNIGDGITNVSQWYDEIFLSADSVLSDGDILVGRLRHNTSLAAGDSYTDTAAFTLPKNIQGEYNIIVNVDRFGSSDNSNRVLEISEANNTLAGTGKINIALDSVPDLTITSVSADTTGIGGQALDVSWTVANSGAAASGKWNDGVYLSRDRIFDRNNGDIFLGTLRHLTGVASNGSYTINTSFDVPRGLSGSYFVIVAADDSSEVFERNGELNNTNFTTSPTQITIPAPADLTPIASSINFASSGVSGEPITVNYQVKNQGVDTAVGRWTDTLYLSKDDVWDLNDAVLGSFEHRGDVAPNSTYSGSITTNIPGVKPDNYRVIVRSDVRDGVLDTNIANDTVASTGNINIDFATLTVGGSVTGSLAQSQAVYYKFQGVAGQAIRLNLDSADNSGANGLYVKYGNVPTRGQFDRTGNNPLDADQDMIVPIGQDGTYYVMAYGNSVTGAPGFNLTATEVPFSITNVTTKVVGNIGKASVKIEGALFEEGTTFQLVDKTGNVIDQVSDKFKSSTEDFATFDLAGKSAGLYDLQATQVSGTKSLLQGAITVQDGLGANPDVGIEGPNSVRLRTKNPIYVDYGNSGDTDMAAPLLIVRANDKAAISLDSKFDVQSQLNKSVQIYGAGSDVGLDKLRPQEVHSIPLYFASTAKVGSTEERANASVSEYSIYSTEQISDADWVMLRDSAKPSGVSVTEWDNFWQPKQAGIGATWGDYAKLVQQLAAAYNKPNESTTDVSQLFSQWYADTNSVSFQFHPKSSISGQIVDDKGQVVKGAGLLLYKIAADGSTVNLPNSANVENDKFFTDNDGKFFIPGVEAGEYQIRLDNNLIFTPSLDIYSDASVSEATAKDFRVEQDQSVSGLKWTVYPSAPPQKPSANAGSRNVKAIIDGNGDNHIFWKEQGQLWTATYNGSSWVDVNSIADMSGSYDVQVQNNLIGGQPGIIVTWEGGVGNNSEIYYSVARVNGSKYQWSKPISLTNNVVADVNPIVGITDTGIPVIINQKYSDDSNNNTKHLYYNEASLSQSNLQWVSGSPTASNKDILPAWATTITLPGLSYTVPSIVPVLGGFTISIARVGSAKSDVNCGSASYDGVNEGRVELEKKYPDSKSKQTRKVTGAQSTSYKYNWTVENNSYKFEKIKRSTNYSISPEVSTTALDVLDSLPIPTIASTLIKSVLNKAANLVGGDASVGAEGTFSYQSSITAFKDLTTVGSGSGTARVGVFGKISVKPYVDIKVGGSVAIKVTRTYSSSGTKTSGDVSIRGYVELKFPRLTSSPTTPTPFYTYRATFDKSFINGFDFPDFLLTDSTSTPQDLSTSSGFVDSSQFISPVYGSNTVVADIGKDASQESAPTVIRGSDGQLLTSWIKFGDYNTSSPGDSIEISKFNGVNWEKSTQVFYSNTSRIAESKIALDSANHSLAVWTMSDPNFVSDNTDITTFDQAVDLAKRLGDSTDIYYSSTDSQGNWSTAKAITLSGADTDIVVGKVSNGNNALVWINNSNNTANLEVATWNGSSWTAPEIVASGNIGKPSVSELAGKTTIFWSQILDSNPSQENIYFSSYNGSWSTPTIFQPQVLPANNYLIPWPRINDLVQASYNPFYPPTGFPNRYFPADCKKDDPNPPAPAPNNPYDPNTQGPFDPNDINGPTGYGAEKWVNAIEPLDYTIRFENVATASAPAKIVTVTQQLDADLDWRSFRLDSFSWGDIYISVPKNSAFFSQRIDVRNQYGVYVDVSASIDIRTGIAKWELRAIDPTTGDIPLDPTKGFLPPNDPENKGIGEGAVAYHINAKAGATTGSTVDAQASIVFDNNEPIETPKIFNTLDVDLPASTVTVLQPQSNDPNFQLSWTGSDDASGSGIYGYAVYVSANGDDYQLLDTVTETTLSFEGEVGDTYSFYVLAIDNTGNIQAKATSTPTSISIGGPGILSFTNAEYSVNESGSAIATITIQRTNGSIGTIAATITLSNVTASGGGQPFFNSIDYDNKPITVSFADGETSKVITVPINNDTLVESNETVSLILTNPTGGATLGNQSTAQLTIVDNNIQIGFSRTNFKIKEDGTAINEIQVVRSGRVDVAVGATLILSDITATSGLDYNGNPIQVNFAAGETTKIVTLPIVNDTLAEGDEAVSLKLTNPTNGAALGSNKEAILSIVDNETNLKFNLSATGNIDPLALAGFTTAANNWAKTLNNKADINVSIDFQDLGAGTLGQTVSEYANYRYADVYAALSRKRLSTDDFQAFANLQTGSQFNLLINRTSNNPNGSGSLASYLDNNNNANNTTVRLNRSNAKALGLVAANAAGTDATLIFNSNSSIKWDFNPNDGISTGSFDFIGTVTHELGHSLGFESGVDVLDSNKSAADKDYTYVSALDLFRFSTESVAQGKGVIDFTASTADKYFSIDGGLTKIASFATGVNYGDGKQPQHWKDGLGLGLLDPTVSPGERSQIFELDKRALDVIGWDITNAAIDRPKTVKNDFGKDYKSDILWRNTDGRVVIWQMDGVNVLSDVLINRPAPLDWQIVSTGDFDGDSKSDILWRNIDSRVVIWQMDGATVLSDKFIDRPAPLDWQIVSTADFDGDSKSDILWRNTDGRVVIWQMDGVKVLSDKFIDRPAPLDWQIVSTADFNGDGKSDILWRNDDGRVVIWQMDGATVLSDKFINQPAPLDWQIVSTNDFNGDGKSDILWRNIDGRVVIWQMDGVNVLSDKFIDRPAPLDWQITGTSDFNGDSKSDILWRNIDGRVVVWQMDGTTVLSDRFIDRPAPLDWQIAAPVAGLGFDRPKAVKNDFGKDYKSDILWRNNDGRVVIWKMDGATVISDKFIDRPAPLDWQIVSTGDFDGDKKSDILWRNTDGRVVIWRMDGVKVLSDKFIDRPAPLDWQIVSTGDFNGDKKSDILWRNDDGRVVIWQMDGATVLSDKFIDRPAPLDWQIVSTDDFNGDGKSDILWRNNDGRVVIWQMDGVKVLSDTFVDRSAPLDWQIAGTGDFNGDRKSDILWRNNDGRVVIWQMNGSEVVSDAFIDRAAPLDWQIAGTVDLNGDGKSDILWRNNDGRVVEWLLDGSTVLADNYVANVDNSWQIVAPTISLPIEKPTFVPELPKPIEPNAVKNDFGKDYKSDILWRNTDGRVVIWQMNGSEVISDTFIDSFAYTGGDRPAPLDWQIASTGDFNGDKKSDILWRNNDGRVVIWQMNGNEVLSDTLIDRPAPLDWQIAGTGDFNGDKKSDILWRNNDGRVVIWQMDGTAVLSDTFIDRPAPLDWQIAGTGDFNGDKKSDILWRNTDGRVAIWQMDGATVLSDTFIDRPISNDWVIEGVDDFNNDGKSDILWRNSNSGLAYIYEMNNNSIINEGIVGQADVEWQIAGTGDYNGDAHADILWRNDSGLTYLWTMNGLNQLGQKVIKQVDNSWQISAPIG
jgi:hypothetical protein